MEHLTAQAAVIVRLWPPQSISDRVFLDVYTANCKAHSLYHDKCQFVILNPDTPILDPNENNEPYFIMARNVAVSA